MGILTHYYFAFYLMGKHLEFKHIIVGIPTKITKLPTCCLWQIDPDTLRVCQGQCACTVSGYKQRYQYKNQHLRLLSQKCIPKVLNFFSMNRISINFNECLYIDRSYLFDLSTSSAYECHSVEVSNWNYNRRH